MAAYRGWAVWSRYDAAPDRYMVVASEGVEAPVALPVRSRAVPFDRPVSI